MFNNANMVQVHARLNSVPVTTKTFGIESFKNFWGTVGESVAWD